MNRPAIRTVIGGVAQMLSSECLVFSNSTPLECYFDKSQMFWIKVHRNSPSCLMLAMKNCRRRKHIFASNGNLLLIFAQRRHNLHVSVTLIRRL